MSSFLVAFLGMQLVFREMMDNLAWFVGCEKTDDFSVAEEAEVAVVCHYVD